MSVLTEIKKLIQKLEDEICRLYGVKTFRFDGGVLIVRAKFAWLFDDTIPWRMYTWYLNPKEPARYIEYEIEDLVTGVKERRQIIIHNIFAWKNQMEVQNVDVVEAIILNELHELTHWAIVGSEEDRYWQSVGDEEHSRLWDSFLLKLIREFREGDGNV